MARANNRASTMAFDRLKASWEASTIKVFYDIVALESGQGLLPISTKLMGGCLAAYAARTGGRAFARSRAHAGSACSAFPAPPWWAGGTAGVLELYKRRDKTIQTITALAGVGAFIALVSIILHFIFAVALPPPLPTQRLVNFLLFPIVLWLVFSFAFILSARGDEDHTRLRLRRDHRDRDRLYFRDAHALTQSKSQASRVGLAGAAALGISPRLASPRADLIVPFWNAWRGFRRAVNFMESMLLN